MAFVSSLLPADFFSIAESFKLLQSCSSLCSAINGATGGMQTLLRGMLSWLKK